MALVAYSDSEGSEDEQPQPQQKVDKPTIAKPAATSTSNFTVNKANPRRIQVKLQDVPSNDDADGEPAAKRPRLGSSGGAFSGFNAMLPPPKRDADVKASAKPAARKVFSLKTGAEPGFSREGDAESRQLFAEQEQHTGNTSVDTDDTIPSIAKSTNPPTAVTIQTPAQGNVFMFKPLSVARGKKSRRKVETPKGTTLGASNGSPAAMPKDVSPAALQSIAPAPPPKKVSLFSMNNEPEPSIQPHPQEEEDEIIEILDEPYDQSAFSAHPDPQTIDPIASQPQSLDAIASDLNLSKADRRQLFGRRGHQNGSAVNVVNFNTDQEYEANEVLRASGEQIQHNPVRAIAPGKHSLKQLVSAAQGQKEALEDSFASGRRNKAEAGSKYGW
ncbi:hypothetical protein H2200_006817 [Cladophialophora chaetospira]|uniref:Mitotic checkpoint regulator, MAD2B-interacting-domain-containing protein n=1 Tax=Cladophialophora chaetospira TaxID=386627 RepID=A0AA38X8X5_9EURO|nr:hypothetical protein H2200_006817 [Cladophialophora chaetospira]